MESILTKSKLKRLWDGIKAKFATKESVYTRDEVDYKLSTEVADKDHNHDDRYYTEDELFYDVLKIGDGSTLVRLNRAYVHSHAYYSEGSIYDVAPYDKGEFVLETVSPNSNSDSDGKLKLYVKEFADGESHTYLFIKGNICKICKTGDYILTTNVLETFDYLMMRLD